MTLIKCPECSKEISDRATKCINCGHSFVEEEQPQEDSRKCTECGGTIFDNSASECPYCGCPIEKEEEGLAKEAAKADKSKQTKAIIVAVVAIAVVAMIIFGFTTCSRGTTFKSIAADYKGASFFSAAEDGSYIEVDTNPNDTEDYSGTSGWGAIEDINKKLGLSDAIGRQMENTRALDGMQAAEENGIKLSWTYHPDKGLEVIYKKA